MKSRHLPSPDINRLLAVVMVAHAALLQWGCSASAGGEAAAGTAADIDMRCSPGKKNGKAGLPVVTLLSNKASVPATVDTATWPAKPWPEKMVWIPAGAFNMGGVGKEARPDEFPVHKVTVNGFWMDQTEVTNADFKTFADATKYRTTAERKPEWAELKKQLPPETPRPSEDLLVAGSMVFAPTRGPVDLNDYSQWWRWEAGADWRHPDKAGASVLEDTAYRSHPVVQVSWYDAAAFARWKGKRIPTEAEWERAARGGAEGEVYGWGNDAPDDKHIKANIWQGQFPYNNTQQDGYVLTAPVASYAPNPYGLYDMMGNVWEWCADWYRPDTYAAEAKGGVCSNPKGPASGFDPDEPYAQKRVVRGGSFLCNAAYCASYRPSARMKTSEDTGENHTGFRCVMTDAEWRQQARKWASR